MWLYYYAISTSTLGLPLVILGDMSAIPRPLAVVVIIYDLEKLVCSEGFGQ